MDDLLEECFFHAIKTRISSADLPLLTSTFYSAHMLPLCPGNLKLDLKKSKFKKVQFYIVVIVLYLHREHSGDTFLDEVVFYYAIVVPFELYFMIYHKAMT